MRKVDPQIAQIAQISGLGQVEAKKARGAFHRELMAWYAAHHRDLPWRRTKDPYAIAVSEFMLQQTQVVTVIPYYHAWLKRFPDWKSLATAREAEVLKAWEGLGYYTRARNLQRLAKAVVELGGLPADVESLRRLPGIGPYTAGALASIIYGQAEALVDGNVIRVFARVFALSANVSLPATQKQLWLLARALVPAADCGTYNQALMELGALICTPRQPQCLVCPLRRVCRAPEPEKFPIKHRTKTESREECVAVIESKGRWWMVPGPERGRLAGFWHFPEFSAATMRRGETFQEFTYGITKYRVRLTAVRAEWKGKPPGPGRWIAPRDLLGRAVSAAHRKIIAALRGVN